MVPQPPLPKTPAHSTGAQPWPKPRPRGGGGPVSHSCDDTGAPAGPVTTPALLGGGGQHPDSKGTAGSPPAPQHRLGEGTEIWLSCKPGGVCLSAVNLSSVFKVHS